jgi:hypothetical protein
MAKYLFAYQGGGFPEGEEAQRATMEAWTSWFASLGAAVLDGGAPLGASASVGGGAAASGLAGYSIIEASDLAAALKMGEGCPVLAEGGKVDVYETVDLPA